jgi:transposase InsO family protein
MEYIEKDTPFRVVEWHPDSGSEFINWHCYDWCEDRGTRLTRSRPNRKNDNCFVEERNGHIVRRWVGYSRLDAGEVVGALNAVYDVLTPYLNHFVSSRRTVSKERIGARWKISREKISKTPYQRILERNDVDEDVKTKLKQAHEKLNPLIMKDEIDQKLKTAFSLQKHHGKPTLIK